MVLSFGPTCAVLDLPVAELNATLQRLISSSRLIFSSFYRMRRQQGESMLNVAERFCFYYYYF